MPDWKIKRWDESNFDVNSTLYSAEAYRMGSMAHVADVARVHALLSEGGIYLDTDVELCDSLDKWCSYPTGCLAMESDTLVGTGVMAAPRNATWVRKMAEYYSHTHFVNRFGHPVRTPNTKILTNAILPGLQQNQYPHLLSLGTIAAGPSDRLGNPESESPVAIHHYMASWRKKRTSLSRIKTLFKGVNARYFSKYQ